MDHQQIKTLKKRKRYCRITSQNSPEARGKVFHFMEAHVFWGDRGHEGFRKHRTDLRRPVELPPGPYPELCNVEARWVTSKGKGCCGREHQVASME